MAEMIEAIVVAVWLGWPFAAWAWEYFTNKD